MQTRSQKRALEDNEAVEPKVKKTRTSPTPESLWNLQKPYPRIKIKQKVEPPPPEIPEIRESPWNLQKPYPRIKIKRNAKPDPGLKLKREASPDPRTKFKQSASPSLGFEFKQEDIPAMPLLWRPKKWESFILHSVPKMEAKPRLLVVFRTGGVSMNTERRSVVEQGPFTNNTAA